MSTFIFLSVFVHVSCPSSCFRRHNTPISLFSSCLAFIFLCLCVLSMHLIFYVILHLYRIFPVYFYIAVSFCPRVLSIILLSTSHHTLIVNFSCLPYPCLFCLCVPPIIFDCNFFLSAFIFLSVLVHVSRLSACFRQPIMRRVRVS